VHQQQRKQRPAAKKVRKAPWVSSAEYSPSLTTQQITLQPSILFFLFSSFYLKNPPFFIPPSPGNKLWGGRFTGETDPVMEAFNASIGFDKRMWKQV